MARDARVQMFDFFSMDKENSCDSRLGPSVEQRRRFNGIQSVISKINPQLLKSVIASGAKTNAPVTYSTVPCAPSVDREVHPPLPLYAPVHRPSMSDWETAPLTILYSGTVMVFDVPPHKAEGILKLAVSRSGSAQITKSEIPTVVCPVDHRVLLGSLPIDLPMARRISLQRFLEKRRERLTSSTPYYRDNKKTQ